MTLPDELTRALRAARSAGVITGAGISAESGIPTYRGKGGVYDDPEEGDRTVDALSGDTLREDPDRTWAALATLLAKAAGALPGPGHRALAELERKAERFALLTQNVDGLHRAAGSREVIEIHGSMERARCMRCGAERPLAEVVPDPAALTAAPRCGCGGVLRPDVVLFGELLPEARVARLRRAFYHQVPDVVIVVGTSALFPYITEPVVVAAAAGKLTIEINPERTLLSHVVDHSLRAPAGEVLPAIATAFGSD